REDRAEEQDRAAGAVVTEWLVAHHPDHARRHEGMAAKVEREGPIPRVAGHRVDRAIAERAATPTCRREERIDPPEPLDCRRNRYIDRRLVTQVARRPAGVREALSQRAGMASIARYDEDGCALGCGALRGSRRDPGRSGDED